MTATATASATWPPRVAVQVAVAVAVNVQDQVHGRRWLTTLRFSVPDRSAVLGQYDVSIEQMVQEGHETSEPVAVVVLTHPAREGDVQRALKDIAALDLVTAPSSALRIEEL